MSGGVSGRLIVALAGVVFALLASTPAPAEELGRLFLTPAERAWLDDARRRRAEPEAAAPAPQTPTLEFIVEDTLPEGPAVRLDGYVQRSGGPATVWVNGEDSYQGDLGAHGVDGRGVDVRRQGVSLPMAETGRTVTLKPGQTWDPAAGAVSDAWERPEAP